MWWGRRNQRTEEQLAYWLQAIWTWLMFKSPFPRTLSGFFRGSPLSPSTITHLIRSHACFSGLFLVPLTFYASATADSLLPQEISLPFLADIPTADPSQGPCRSCNSDPQSKTRLWFLSAQAPLSLCLKPPGWEAQPQPSRFFWLCRLQLSVLTATGSQVKPSCWRLFGPHPHRTWVEGSIPCTCPPWGKVRTAQLMP